MRKGANNLEYDYSLFKFVEDLQLKANALSCWVTCRPTVRPTMSIVRSIFVIFRCFTSVLSTLLLGVKNTIYYVLFLNCIIIYSLCLKYSVLRHGLLFVFLFVFFYLLSISVSNLVLFVCQVGSVRGCCDYVCACTCAATMITSRETGWNKYGYRVVYQSLLDQQQPSGARKEEMEYFLHPGTGESRGGDGDWGPLHGQGRSPRVPAPQAASGPGG